MTPAELRALFPATRSFTYLNAAAASPIALPVEKAVRAHYQEGVAQGDQGFGNWLRRREEIRGQFARFIGAAAAEVAFTPSTSFGFQVVAQLMRQRGIREVVTLEGEFPSTTLPFLANGMTLKVVRPRPDGAYSVEDVEAAIGRRTGAVVLSAVQFASGFRMDLPAVSRLCRERKLLFAVNGAQTVGQVQLDATRDGFDFLCATSHKWLFGGYGVGLFFARQALLAEGDIPMCGWLSVENPMAMDNLVGAKVTGRGRKPYFQARGTRFRQDAAVLEGGCVAFGPLFGVGAALRLHEQVGHAATAMQIRTLQAQLRAGLRQRGFEPNAPDDPARGSGICVIPVEGKAEAAVRALLQEGVAVTPRGVGVRISTHVFNTPEDVDRMFAFLKADTEKADLDWKQRARTNLDRMTTGGLLGLAEVVKGLQILSELRPLPTKERELYDNARHLLVAEISAAMGVEEKTAEDAVDVALFPPGKDRPKRTAEEFKRRGEDDEDLDIGDDLLGIAGDLDLPAEDEGEESSEEEGEEAEAEEGEEAAPKGKGKAKAAKKAAVLSDDEVTQPMGTALVPDEALPPRRKRGRPPKPKPEGAEAAAPKKRGRPPKPRPEGAEAAAPRKRGRPPKPKPEGAATTKKKK